MTGAEFDHGNLTRAELGQAARQAAALAVHSRGQLARSWRTLAAALGQLAAERDPQHQQATTGGTAG
ncbi:MAG: hypothetical protein GEV12_08615 [Micromonosporaceae bacterium]|nr:hypothetical protein [Micromonosporaceae bacterium]